MIHARKDYNEMGAQYLAMVHIPQDEPVFLLRATDLVAPKVVRIWASEHIEMADNSEYDQEVYGRAVDMANAATDHADLMEAWPNRKLADVGVCPPKEVGIPDRQHDHKLPGRIQKVKVAGIPFRNIFDGVLSPLVAGMETKEYNQMLDALCDVLEKAFDAAEEVEKPWPSVKASESPEEKMGPHGFSVE